MGASAQSESIGSICVCIEASGSMFYSVKEKSWSVLLIKGYVLNDEVRAIRCENCKSTTEVLTANHHNPNLLLYGCKDTKCRHRMVRLDFDGQNASLRTEKIETPMLEKPSDFCSSPSAISIFS